MRVGDPPGSPEIDGVALSYEDEEVALWLLVVPNKLRQALKETMKNARPLMVSCASGLMVMTVSRWEAGRL